MPFYPIRSRSAAANVKTSHASENLAGLCICRRVGDEVCLATTPQVNVRGLSKFEFREQPVPFWFAPRQAYYIRFRLHHEFSIPFGTRHHYDFRSKTVLRE